MGPIGRSGRFIVTVPSSCLYFTMLGINPTVLCLPSRTARQCGCGPTHSAHAFQVFIPNRALACPSHLPGTMLHRNPVSGDSKIPLGQSHNAI